MHEDGGDDPAAPGPAPPVTPIHAVADRLIGAYDAASLVERISDTYPDFDIDAAYEVLRVIEGDRAARGWRPVGRKIGFTNHTLWPRYGVDGPMWARMWDRTVRFADDGADSVPLERLLQPRIEPEIVFGLADAVPPDGGALDILASVEWIAAGFEVVQCHFADWRFTAAECTAAFGLHAALVVGTPTPLRSLDPRELAVSLATFEATLARDGAVVERGSGANVLGSPALALGHLARLVAGQPGFDPPGAGEVITTGTLTDAHSVAPGERWTSDYGELGIPGLSVTFR